MAKAGTIKKNQAGFRALIQSSIVTGILQNAASAVVATARSSAKSAELGSTRLEGYASAGFGTVLQKRSRRQRILIGSNAPAQLAMRVHFATQKVNGIGHLRQAVKDTKGVEWPSKR